MLTMTFNPTTTNTSFVVAHSQMDSVETYFTDPDTPVHLVDPITGVIYKCPVVLPSGKTVSIQIAEFKPRFDIFTNKPFEPDQVCLSSFVSFNVQHSNSIAESCSKSSFAGMRG